MNRIAQHPLLPLAVLVGAAMVLGLAPILVRLADTGPTAAAFWRFVFALPLLVLVTARTAGGGLGSPSKPMALAALFFVLDFSFWHYGIVMTSVANATLLCNLAPVVVTLFVWLAWGERPARIFILALVLALAGAAAMAAGASGEQGSNPLLGDLLSTGTAVWYAGYFLAVSVARRRATAFRVMTWSTLIATPGLLAVSLILGEQIFPASLGGWLACAAMGLMHIVGQGGVTWALGRVPASLTSLVVLIQPVAAAALAWMLFAETMTPIQMAGGVLVLIGIVLAQRSSRRTTGAMAKAPAPAAS